MENRTNQNTICPRNEINNDSIDWMAYLVKALKNYKFILLATVIFFILGVLATKGRRRMFAVTVELAPEVKSRSNSTASSLARMLGGSGGFSGGDENDALNVSLFPDICSSTPFLMRLFDVQVKTLKDDFLGRKSQSLYTYVTTPKDSVSIFTKIIGGVLEKLQSFNSDEEMLNGAKMNKFENTPFRMDRKHRYAVKYLASCIKADFDKKTYITTISVRMDDPLIAATLADTVCQRLQDYIIEYRTRKAKADLNYYLKLEQEAKEKYISAQQAYSACVDYDQSVILQSVKSEKDRLQTEMNMASQVYSQMRQQVEGYRAKVQEAKPAFAVVQPATVPTRPIGRSRKMIVLMWAMVGFALSTAWVVYLKDKRKEIVAQFKEMMHSSKADGACNEDACQEESKE